METTPPKPLISFVITYYNQPVPMLCECIDSIMALSLRPFEREIIIIDDGSDVSPMNGLMQYGNDIIYIRQKNAGLSMARNKGIDISTGQYLQFVDADDQLIPATYELCLDVIRYQPAADTVMFSFSETPKASVPSLSASPVSGCEYMRHQNIHGTACGYIFRKAILGNLRFTPDIYHEDEEFTPQLLLRAELLFPMTFAKAYYYRKRPGSIMTRNDDENVQKRLDDTLGVIVRLSALCDKVPVSDKLALQRRIAQLTMAYIYNTIMDTRSRRMLEDRLSDLHAKGLFPLPANDYGSKYNWFRRMTNSSMGRSILLHTLPLMKRER